jgi:hypothetical protein
MLKRALTTLALAPPTQREVTPAITARNALGGSEEKPLSFRSMMMGEVDRQMGEKGGCSTAHLVGAIPGVRQPAEGSEHSSASTTAIIESKTPEGYSDLARRIITRPADFSIPSVLSGLKATRCNKELLTLI